VDNTKGDWVAQVMGAALILEVAEEDQISVKEEDLISPTLTRVDTNRVSAEAHPSEEVNTVPAVPVVVADPTEATNRAVEANSVEAASKLVKGHPVADLPMDLLTTNIDELATNRFTTTA